MGVSVPDCVSFEADKTAGLDLLGLRPPVQALGNALFDGVTTVTPKLRYMSVISWIVWRYAQARRPEKRSDFFRLRGGARVGVRHGQSREQPDRDPAGRRRGRGRCARFR